jgi:hypothetical protein
VTIREQDIVTLNGEEYVLDEESYTLVRVADLRAAEQQEKEDEACFGDGT